MHVSCGGVWDNAFVLFLFEYLLLAKKNRHIYIKFFFSEHPDQTVYSTVDEKKKEIPETNKVLAQGKIKHACVVSHNLFFFIYFSLFS